MFAEQAVEVLFPQGAPQSVSLTAATSSAVIDLALTLGIVANASDTMPSGGFHIMVSCTSAFTARGGATDPGAAIATDFPYNATTPYRFKVTPQSRFARFFSTPGGTLSYALASR